MKIRVVMWLQNPTGVHSIIETEVTYTKDGRLSANVERAIVAGLTYMENGGDMTIEKVNKK